MGILYAENRDGDMVRDVIYQRWNSNAESVENGISNVMELEASGLELDQRSGVKKGN